LGGGYGADEERVKARTNAVRAGADGGTIDTPNSIFYQYGKNQPFGKTMPTVNEKKILSLRRWLPELACSRRSGGA
jgi:hypothetical protein